MKRKYKKPQISKIKVDNQISLVMMTQGNENEPPWGPYGKMHLENNNKTNPYKA